MGKIYVQKKMVIDFVFLQSSWLTGGKAADVTYIELVFFFGYFSVFYIESECFNYLHLDIWFLLLSCWVGV